ncbi:MAG: phosphate acyltransferase PlsX [Candidatus Melainabacteria bacterium]|jgi:glycerol-3-phosphate acyltransferase PlsX|nr:phosphate acyltransferase PlsX [Candidatus Melainabacteria bacterium]
MIRIAVDAMGGDHAPREVVHGSVIAAREYGVAVQLVGPPDAIEKELTRHDHSGLDISIVAASEVVAMDEKPGRAIVKKKDSSIVVATKLVSDGKADGLVAAGSTGAAAVAAQLGLGRIDNVDRSAICCTMPATTGKCLLVDAGANVDCTPYQLMQFGVMGSIVSAGLFGKKNPTVGLLNIGTEETKGNELVQDALKLLKQQSNINFIGFVEGRDFPLGKVDVTVTDGFTGNIALKTAEGIANMCKIMLKQELLKSTRTKLGAVVIQPALDGLKNRVDHNVFGGALLVGVKGVCVIAHGGSKHTAIKNAIRVAKDMVAADIVKKIENSFSMTAAGSKS